ncbi:hypothetical protein K0M31_000543 [Melipona bicolor]|uniref:Uncharacterized protein n=1 Tax=Melipona bicolor TaxID=60889 RepID=A0AA40GDQ7_9HYME|nr:hypothetical protein K0M31_000543 [Melipona bicolor]
MREMGTKKISRRRARYECSIRTKGTRGTNPGKVVLQRQRNNPRHYHLSKVESTRTPWISWSREKRLENWIKNWSSVVGDILFQLPMYIEWSFRCYCRGNNYMRRCRVDRGKAAPASRGLSAEPRGILKLFRGPAFPMVNWVGHVEV